MSSRVLCEISQLKYNLRCIYSFTTPEAILFCGLDNEDSFPTPLCSSWELATISLNLVGARLTIQAKDAQKKGY